MSTETFLARLEGVKRKDEGRWIAKCPAHDDERPSLAIRELDDGRVLVHDFGGCAVEHVLAAVGLTFDDLYPARAADHRTVRERRPFNALDVLQCVGMEALIAVVATTQVAEGKPLADGDRERLLLAAGRLQCAVDVADGA